MADRNDDKKPTRRTPKPRQKLNIRERKFVKGLAAGLTATEAMRQAGYAETTASRKQGEKLAKVRPAMREALEAAGLTTEKLAQTIIEGLSSNRVISAIPGNEANGGTTDFIEVPDYKTRHLYIDTSLKVRGDYPKEKVEVEHTGKVTLVID